jgi:hypothetical protein
VKKLSVVIAGVLAVWCLAIDRCPAQDPAQAVPPRGTFVRPPDGIKGIDALDQAWNEYKKAVDEVRAGVAEGFKDRTMAAQAKPDLQAVEREQAAERHFGQAGVLAGHAAAQADATKAARAFQKANATLTKAYEQASDESTRAGDIRTARDLRDERGGLEAGLGFPQSPNVPESVFDGKAWVGWGQGWGGGRVSVDDKAAAVLLTAPMYFAHERLVGGDFAFEAEVRRHDWPPNPPDSGFQLGIQTDKGACLIRIPARNDQGQPIANSGELVHYDAAIRQNHVLKAFVLPRGIKKWQLVRFSRRGDTCDVSVDGAQVLAGVPVPIALRKECNLAIGTMLGEVDFRKLELTAIMIPPPH